MNRHPARRRTLSGSPFNAKPGAAPSRGVLKVSDRVLHGRHGMGRIVVVEDEATVRVDFGSGGLRRVRAETLTGL